MARLDEVVGAELAASVVVDRYDVTPVRPAAEEHDGYLVLEGFLHRARLAGKSQEHYPGDAVLEQRFDTRELALAVTFGVAEHRRISPRGRVSLHRLRHLGEERVGEVADDHAQDAGPLLH